LTTRKESFKIFISATYEDLLDERKNVLEAIRLIKYQHITMEYFGADNRESIEVCLENVRKSDIYVGIIAHRYGSIVKGTEKSYTQMEYEEAIKIGLPCYIYIKSDKVPVLPEFIEKNPESMKKLNEFKDILKKNHTPNYFSNSNDLAIKIVVDLSKRIKELDYEVLENILKIVTQNYRQVQIDTNSKFHYIQKRMEKFGLIETMGTMCPVCGRLLEKGDMEVSFGYKHPVCADCIVYRTKEVINQLERDHPDMVFMVDECKQAAEKYLVERDKK
jgi:hypothetical protein